MPRRVSHPQRKTIGLRVPDHHVLQALAALHGAPLLSTTLIAPGETEALNDAQEIRERFQHQLAGVVDAGACPSQPTTVIDLTPMGTGGEAVVVREGRGSSPPRAADGPERNAAPSDRSIGRVNI